MNCDAAMAIQTMTTASPDTETRTIYTVCAGITLDIRDKIPPKMLKTNATIGIPLLFNFPKDLPIIPSFDRDHNMRVAQYSPEFAQDKIAVKITKFMIVPEYGMPILLSTVTYGL